MFEKVEFRILLFQMEILKIVILPHLILKKLLQNLMKIILH
jgi:hypothetical protein